MTVWMVQMKYFVKIKEGVKSKAKLYIPSTVKTKTNFGRLGRQGNNTTLLMRPNFEEVFIPFQNTAIVYE